jgi:hypothetical protein
LILQSRSKITIHWCQAWLLAEFLGSQKQIAELNDRFRLRFDIAGTPRKPFLKIDNADASCAFGAEDASEITHCYRVLSKQIPVYPPARADRLSAGHSVIERN